MPYILRFKKNDKKVIGGVSPRTGRRLTRILLLTSKTGLDHHGNIIVLKPTVAYVGTGGASLAPSDRTMPKVKAGKLNPDVPQSKRPIHGKYGTESRKDWNKPVNPPKGKPYR